MVDTPLDTRSPARARIKWESDEIKPSREGFRRRPSHPHDPQVFATRSKGLSSEATFRAKCYTGYFEPDEPLTGVVADMITKPSS